MSELKEAIDELITFEEREERRKSLVKDIAEVLNRHSRENESDTPDFILAELMVTSLEQFEAVLSWRKQWYSPEGVRSPEDNLLMRMQVGDVVPTTIALDPTPEQAEEFRQSVKEMEDSLHDEED